MTVVAGDHDRAVAGTAVARAYYRAAERAAEWDSPFSPNVAAGNAVFAAIAAADAICCLRLGPYHAGQDFRAATKMLNQVQPDGRELAKHLAEALAVRHQAHYSGDPLPRSRMHSVLRSTARLLEAAERLLADTGAR